MARKYAFIDGKIFISLEEAACIVLEMQNGTYPGSHTWAALDEVAKLFNRIELNSMREINAKQTGQ